MLSFVLPFLKKKKKQGIRNPDSRHWTGGTGASKRERLLPNCIVGTALVQLTWAVSIRLQNKQPSIFQKWTWQSLIKVWGRTPECSKHGFHLRGSSSEKDGNWWLTCPSLQQLLVRMCVPLLAGKCYLKVSVTHTGRLMVGVIFLHRLDCNVLDEGICDVIG